MRFYNFLFVIYAKLKLQLYTTFEKISYKEFSNNIILVLTILIYKKKKYHILNEYIYKINQNCYIMGISKSFKIVFSKNRKKLL